MQIRLDLKDVGEFLKTVSSFTGEIDIRSIHNRVYADAKSGESLCCLDFGSTLNVEINSVDENEINRFNKEMEKYEVKNANQ